MVVYGNGWALQEQPKRPSPITWSFEESLDRLAEAGYDGCQAGIGQAAAVRARGLRFCTSARINTPGEADAAVAAAAAVNADCLTVHAGWGDEDDATADAIAAAICEAEARHGVPVYIETHRATMMQDIYRTCRLVDRHPALGVNADLSHFYCGQEMTYRGFERTIQYLTPVLARVGFIHARVSDGQCMQCDIADERHAVHVSNFTAMWSQAMRSWRSRAVPGDLFPFVPELGPPSSGYSLLVRDAAGELVEVCDRWAQSLQLKSIAERAFGEVGVG